MEKEFTITLPVSQQAVVLRRSTLLDEIINDREFSKKDTDQNLRNWAMIGRTIVSIGGKPGPVEADALLGLASQDGDYLLRFYLRLNTLTPKMNEEIEHFFDPPATESSPS